MSITTVCRACGDTFRKFSMKSREQICESCRGTKGKNRYRVMTNKTMNAIGTIETLDKKINNNVDKDFKFLNKLKKPKFKDISRLVYKR